MFTFHISFLRRFLKKEMVSHFIRCSDIHEVFTPGQIPSCSISQKKTAPFGVYGVSFSDVPWR